MSRNHLLSIYRQALAAVHGRCVVRAALQRDPSRARHAVAIGKAAGAMLGGAFDACGERVRRALLVTRHGYARLEDGFAPACTTVIEAGHPEPDAASLVAGQALLEFIAAVPEREEILFLISGGASALVEVLAPGMTLDRLAELTRKLLAGGHDIFQINAARRAVSRIKGGRLVPYLGTRTARALTISDVPGDDLAVIGSGLLYDGIPRANVRHELVATNADARRAAVDAARALGYAVVEHDALLTGPVESAAATLVETLRAGPAGVHVWGGECTVRLPSQPGRGGRCQHLALLAARALAGCPGVSLLCAATDGSDGATPDAGALVDGQTAAAIAATGLDVELSLAQADAGTALASVGAVIHTGPTGTNVMDLMIGLSIPPGVK